MSFAAEQKHVAVLERAGLLTKERRGREQLVHTDGDAVGRARRVLDELEAAWRGRVDRMADLLAQVPGPQEKRGRGRWLTDIKARDGGDVTMSGSATTVRWLLREGLLDELNLLVHPIAVGDGLARLFPPDEPSIPLELLSTFETGVLNLSYGPAED
jgi:riboflavin biosynthesis pyrimidine reductase